LVNSDAEIRTGRGIGRTGVLLRRKYLKPRGFKSGEHSPPFRHLVFHTIHSSRENPRLSSGIFIVGRSRR